MTLKYFLYSLASKDRRRRQPGQEAARFKTDTASGRIVIDDDTFKSTPQSAPEDDVAGQAYREQMTGVDGFTRGPNGEVKFHKNTKKRRAEEAAADAAFGADGDHDVEMGDGSAVTDKKKKKKAEKVSLGQEFRAKVCSVFPILRSTSYPLPSPVLFRLYFGTFFIHAN